MGGLWCSVVWWCARVERGAFRHHVCSEKPWWTCRLVTTCPLKRGLYLLQEPVARTRNGTSDQLHCCCLRVVS